MLLRLTAPHFCAGVVTNGEVVLLSAPIIRYMVGWTEERVFGYCSRKGWLIEQVEESNE